MENKVYLRLASLYKIEYDCEIKDEIFYFKGIFKDIKCDFIYYITEYDKYYSGFNFKKKLISNCVEKFYNEIKTTQARTLLKTLNKNEQKLILRHL
jgi:hypothetical protein